MRRIASYCGQRCSAAASFAMTMLRFALDVFICCMIAVQIEYLFRTLPQAHTDADIGAFTNHASHDSIDRRLQRIAAARLDNQIQQQLTLG